MITWGNYRIHSISGGTFRLDGGAMFGVVPKPLWQKKTEVDAENRIPLDTNCLVIERTGESSPSQYLLVDTGMELSKFERTRAVSDKSLGWPIVDNLRRLGIQAEQITAVTFSHLHFDHAGGAVKRGDDGQVLVPTFSNARHYIQRDEWNDAVGDYPELFGSYYAHHLRPLEPFVEWVQGEAEIWPGVVVEQTGGHTTGHQVIRILNERGEAAIYTGDLFPTSAHLKPLWNMAYDQNQRQTRIQKIRLLRELAKSQAWLLFDHDPLYCGVRIADDGKGGWRLAIVGKSRFIQPG